MCRGAKVISTGLHTSDGSEPKAEQIMEMMAEYNKLTKKGFLPRWSWSGNRITISVSLSIKTDGPVAPYRTRPTSHNPIWQYSAKIKPWKMAVK